METDLNFIEYNSRAGLIEGVSNRLVDQLKQGLATTERVSMSLSGGSTPMPIYAQMARAQLAWDRVVAIPTDERWVSRDHPSNNAHQIRQHLQGHGPMVLDLVPEQVEGQPDVAFAQTQLQTMPAPFQVSVVGMGQDAHFASLFPHNEALSQGLNPASGVDVLGLTPNPLPPEAPFGRVSLSLSKLLHSESLVLLITGEAKRLVLETAWQQMKAQTADATQSPIVALIEHAADRLEIHWSE